MTQQMFQKTLKSLKFDYPLLTITAVALVIRILYLAEIAHNQPFFQNEIFAQEAFPHAPLYHYILTAIYGVFGENTLFPRLMQLLIGAFLTYPLYYIGNRLFERRAGLVIAGIWALYGPEIFFEGELLETSITVALTLFAYLCWLKGEASDKILWFAFAGLTLGLATFMWPNMMLLFPLLGLWLLFHKKAPFSQIKSLILFILGFLLVIAPMTIRYHTVSGKFIPVSTYNGLDFHLGTDTPTNGIAPVLQDVKEQPGKFLLLNLKKTALFFHSYEFADTRDLYFNRSYSIILSSLLWKWGINFPLGVLFPFAFLGIYYMFRNRTSGRGTILIFILGTALSVVILYVCSRFRAPAMPFIIILAGGGVVNAFRGLEGKKTVLNLSIIIPLLILTNIDVLGLQRDISDQEYFNLGWKHLEAGQFQEAYDSFQKSYRANPKYTPALNQLGLILEISRDFRGAAFYYRRALSLNPDDPIAYYNLGAVEGKAGNLDTALVELNKAVALKPDLWQAYVNLGNVYFNKKEFAIAEESYYKALRLVPDNPDIFYNLANLYLFTGDTTKAIENYERVAELSPDYPTVQEMLTKLTSGGK